MKILFICMTSIHAQRWIENMLDSDHELYRYDILKTGSLDLPDSVKQFSYPVVRKLPYIKGEYFLSKNTPRVFDFVRTITHVTENEELENIIKLIQPDIIHSFEMRSCAYPVLKTMKKYKNIKWIYSCWGNDIYFFQNFKYHKKNIYKTLKRIDVLHTDCERDYQLAKEFGFKGNYVGVIPGGAGYDLSKMDILKKNIEERKIILIKGYDRGVARGGNIVKALHQKNHIINEKGLKVKILSTHENVRDYIKQNNLPYEVLGIGRGSISFREVIELFGKSLIYIGNSVSDGMPNTLLEAICMEVFPIQSNPGGATAEIVEHKKNGLLINDPENVDEIAELIEYAINNPEMVSLAQKINREIAIERLDYDLNKDKVRAIYADIEKEIKNENRQ